MHTLLIVEILCEEKSVQGKFTRAAVSDSLPAECKQINKCEKLAGLLKDSFLHNRV